MINIGVSIVVYNSPWGSKKLLRKKYRIAAGRYLFNLRPWFACTAVFGGCIEFTIDFIKLQNP